MKIIFDKKKLSKLIKNEKNLGFVPTMGGIHPGHISLVKKSKNQCKKTIVSIFVNKPQFNKRYDFDNYPRSLKNDILKLRRLNIDYLFLPSEKQIYPHGPNKNIKISPFGNQLCGKSRPGHFIAVTDVINRFVKIIKPKKIFFGNKDFQQLKIIEHFMRFKFPKIKIVGCKTIREKNGMAYSSRNFLLSQKEKKIGSLVYKTLIRNKKFIIKNNKKLFFIKKKLKNFGLNKIDYLKVKDVNKLIKPYKNIKKYKIFIAYHIGRVRLIDNI